MTEHRASWLAYLKQRRQLWHDRYRRADIIPLRHDAREWAMHYGRLVRRMEGRA